MHPNVVTAAVARCKYHVARRNSTPCIAELLNVTTPRQPSSLTAAVDQWRCQADQHDITAVVTPKSIGHDVPHLVGQSATTQCAAIQRLALAERADTAMDNSVPAVATP